MFVVDTNVLVYALNEDSPHHPACHGLITRWRGEVGAWYLTWGNCYEFLRVVTHPRILARPRTLKEAWVFLESIMASPGLGFLLPTERHAEVAAQTFREYPHLSGNILHDAETAILMRENGIRRIYTRDSDLRRFEFLEVVDPTTIQ